MNANLMLILLQMFLIRIYIKIDIKRIHLFQLPVSDSLKQVNDADPK